MIGAEGTSRSIHRIEANSMPDCAGSTLGNSRMRAVNQSISLKFAVALLALLGAAILGLYLADAFIPLLLQVQPTTPWYETWWSYYRVIDVPQVAPHATRIKLAGAIGLGLPLLAWMFLLVPLFRGRPKALHGDARFATAADLARKDMLKEHPDGIVVGKFGGKFVRLPGQQFAILAAPTRSGKGVGIVIPNLLDYQHSMVVLDIKQENFELTSGWRAEQGQDVFLFNPFAEDRRTHRWNPLTYVSRDPAFRISDLASIAAMLYPDGPEEQKFWVSQARNAFLAFALYLFENLDEEQASGFPFSKYPTMGAIYRLSSGNGSELRSFLRQLSQRAFVGQHAKTAFANLLSQADETFASIMGTFKEPLNAWINPVLDAATSGDDFLLTEVRRKRMTIYIGIQPNKLAESRLIVNLFFSQLINQNTRTLPQADASLKYQCLLLMDEFTAIGKVDIIATALPYIAGYGLRLLPIIQSMAQLDAVYGRDVSRTMITNHALQIVFAPREQQDAQDYSDMLGYTTVRKKNRSRSYGQHGTYTLSENEERRALMLPQELKAMGADTEVFFYEGLAHPVKCKKIRYYQEPTFTRRLRPRVEVPLLQLESR
jgi:type IV secretion system protein VirD4